MALKRELSNKDQRSGGMRTLFMTFVEGLDGNCVRDELRSAPGSPRLPIGLEALTFFLQRLPG